MHFLKQSTAVDVLIGPFLDITDGITAEAGESPSAALSKNGQALATKNDATTPVVDAFGYYNCELDATDTNTVGTLRLVVQATGTATPVFHDYQVVDALVYNALFASSPTLLTSQDIGQMYESDVTTVTSQTELIFANKNIVTNNIWVGQTVTLEDVTTGEQESNWITSIVASTDTIVLANTPSFTVAVGDIIRVRDNQHPRYAANAYDAYTGTEGADFNVFIRDWFRLLMRSDAAVATDAVTSLSDLNSDDGSGSGDYNQATDSLEAIDAGVNATAINGSTSAAAQLALSAVGILSGAATGTPSTTVMNSDLTGYANDELIGRTIIWTGGTADGQASDITDYANTSGVVTYTVIATAPGSGDTFVIV